MGTAQLVSAMDEAATQDIRSVAAVADPASKALGSPSEPAAAGSDREARHRGTPPAGTGAT